MRIMAYCPKCKKHMDMLRYHSYMSVEQTCNISGDGGMYYSDFLEYGDHIHDKYRCPHCDALITESESKALKFLKGEWNVKVL